MMSRNNIRRNGLDELMIVNPRPTATANRRQSTPRSPRRYFLGEDGVLYQLSDLQGYVAWPERRAPVFGDLFLSEDGLLFICLRK